MPRTRRRLFIVNNFQRRLLTATILHLTIIVLVAVLLVFIPLNNQLNSSGLSTAQQQLMAKHYLEVRAHMWRALVIVSMLLLVHSIFVSHRAAGPMIRIRQIMSAVAHGDLRARAILRRHDYLSDEAHALNDMVRSLDDSIAGVKASHQHLLATFDDIKKFGTADGARWQELADHMQRLEHTLARFTTSFEAPDDSPAPAQAGTRSEVEQPV